MKTIKVIDEDTLEIKEIVVEEDSTEEAIDVINKKFKQAITCGPEEFAKRYKEFKEAKARFDEVYESTKLNLLTLYNDNPDIPKNVIIGGAVKLTHVAPSTRSTIDSKKLKEEEPELAKKFTKITNVSASIRLEEI
jgi:hypothetical protein